VPLRLSETQYTVVRAALDRTVPGDDLTPGAGEAGGADYVDGLLAAFNFDPPRVWAGGPTSGRHGGAATFDQWLELGPWEERAWRARIEEWWIIYETGLATLGEDFLELSEAEQSERLSTTSKEFRELLFTHACESLYGDPVYGGNRDGQAWQAIDFRGDVQPRGYTDEEVRAP